MIGYKMGILLFSSRGLHYGQDFSGGELQDDNFFQKHDRVLLVVDNQ